jgi:hypothetical protein
MATAAIIGSTAIGAGTSLIGGMNSSNAASQAADDQSQAQAQNIQNWQNILPGLLQNMSGAYGQASNWDQAATNAIYGAGNTAQNSISGGYGAYNTALSNGTTALDNGLQGYSNALSNITSLNNPGVQTYNMGNAGYDSLLSNPSSITSDPGYQFGLQTGSQSLDRSAAASGQLFSGGAQAAQQAYGQNYASTQLNNALGRYSNAITLGQPSVNNTGTANMQAAQGEASLDQALANLNMGVASGTAQVGNNMGQAAMNTGSQVANSAYQQSNLNTAQSAATNNLFSQYLNGTNSANTASGNAQANGAMNSANAENQGIQGVGSSIDSGVNNYLGYNAYTNGLGSSYGSVNNYMLNSPASLDAYNAMPWSAASSDPNYWSSTPSGQAAMMTPDQLNNLLSGYTH